ncbi:MAG: NUDIX domain-containing protein [Clostridia bacterium]|nr:NUDIX domain-containing protein [Clostridia bacterium]
MIATVSIFGQNRYWPYSKTREGARGIVIRDGMLLTVHEQRTGWILLPGGGIEPGESPAECVRREIREETGFLVEAGEEFLTLSEYYGEVRYVSHYFACTVTGEAAQSLTPAEAARGLVPRFLPVREAYDVFSRHADYDGIDEERRGSYLREFTAIEAWFAHIRA